MPDPTNGTPEPEPKLSDQLAAAADDLPEVVEDQSPPSEADSPTEPVGESPVASQSQFDWQSNLRDQGFAIPDGETPQETFTRLSTSLQQGERSSQYLNEITPYWSEFQGWLEEKKAAQAPAGGSDDGPWWKEYWDAPEYDPSWQNMLVRDLEGNLVPAQGAPPDVLHKYQRWDAYRQQTADRFLKNPYEFFDEPIRKLAKEEAREMFKEMIGERDQQVQASQFVHQHSPWLYENDSQGNPLKTAQGTPILSKWGQSFQAHLQGAAEKGWSVQDQQDYALAMVQRDWLLDQQSAGKSADPPAVPNDPQQPPPASPRQAANDKFTAERAAQYTGALPSGPPETHAPGANKSDRDRLDLRAMLRKEIDGFSDSDIYDFASGSRPGTPRR